MSDPIGVCAGGWDALGRNGPIPRWLAYIELLTAGRREKLEPPVLEISYLFVLCRVQNIIKPFFPKADVHYLHSQ